MTTTDDPNKKIQKAVPSEVCMLSMMRSTSSPIGHTTLLPKASSGKTGGALSREFWAALMMRQRSATSRNHISYHELLQSLQDSQQLKQMGEIPQLSSSRRIRVKADPVNVFPNKSQNPQSVNRAVLIGIQYEQAYMRSCHDAVQLSKHTLVRDYSVRDQNITVLVDSPGSSFFPSKYNILASFRQLTAKSKAGDVTFVHFCGHSTTTKPKSDGKTKTLFGDQVLLPSDYDSKGVITPEDLYRSLICNMPSNTSLFILMDCCHGGSVVALPYSYSLKHSDSDMYRDGTFDLAGILGLAVVGASLAGGGSAASGGGDDDCCGGVDCCGDCLSELFGGG